MLLRAMPRAFPNFSCFSPKRSRTYFKAGTLRQLWLALEEDYKKHKSQYRDEHHPFLCKNWTKRWKSLENEQE
jgi:transposase